MSVFVLWITERDYEQFYSLSQKRSNMQNVIDLLNKLFNKMWDMVKEPFIV